MANREPSGTRSILEPARVPLRSVQGCFWPGKGFVHVGDHTCSAVYAEPLLYALAIG